MRCAYLRYPCNKYFYATKKAKWNQLFIHRFVSVHISLPWPVALIKFGRSYSWCDIAKEMALH